jgi:cobalt-zinc-cadmium efflux system outer membrane protein
LARPASAPLQVAGALKGPTVTGDLGVLTQVALAQRPEFRGIRLAQERESLREDEATLTYTPDLDLAVSRHRLIGEPTTWDVTFSVPVPLYFWQPRQGAIAEARANQASLTQQAEHLRQTVALEVEDAYLSTLAAWRQIEMYETNILKQAEEVYELFAFSYQEGELDGLDLIAARRTLLDVRQAYADALFTHKVALAALNRAMGQ